MKFNLKNLVLGFTLVVAAVFAASTFIANNQPFGYISPATLSSSSFAAGDTLAYAPWFDDGDYSGNIIAYPITATGQPLILSPAWNAAGQIASQDYLTGRNIVTTDGAGTASAFLWDSLPAAQQSALGSAEMVNFIRGDRSNEGTAPTSRVRGSLMGDVIHSNPVYAQKPVTGFPGTDYLAFAATHNTRAPMVFVGANDGMLHAFNADTGAEVYAYIPSMVVSRLTTLAADPYAHNYFVDGPLTTGDAKFDGDWHTLLVGGLGAGGKGHFALDITSASAASESDAMDKVLWEFHPGSTGGTNMGYGYSRTSIVKANNDKWTAVFGNGYLSTTGVASLFVLDVEDGSVIRELVVPDAVSNGLSSPTLIDLNQDFKADVAYAGDRNGNLWKFDLSDPDPSNWSVSNSKALFQTLAVDGVRQPITTAPDVGAHPSSGVLVYVATGELLDSTQAADKSLQTVYGIWDNNWDAGDLPVSLASLVNQDYISATHDATGGSVRTATSNAVDWETKRGWKTDLLVNDALELDKGERVLQNISLRDDRVEFVTVNPTLTTGENWYMQLDAYTGGAPSKTIIDVNKDLLLSLADNVDGNEDGDITNTAADRVIGTYLGYGLTSLPTVGGNKGSTSTSLFNHIEAISPTDLSYPDDPGLIGGHFDLDTSHGIYAFGEGKTDKHEHEWDDTHDSTTIDYFDIDGGGHANIDGGTDSVPDGDTPFFITASNAVLNPAGVMEINGSSFSVESYYELQTRWLTDTMEDYESFPVYKLNPVTDTEAAAGWQQLTSFKLSFDAFAILKGELLGTNTGCVKGNDMGRLGEYRNGAMTVQALDAADFDGFTYDSVNDVYIAANTAVDGTHQYARVKPGDDDEGEDEVFGKSMFWESTVFWHWDGDCYHQEDWQDQYDACLAQTEESFCWVADEEQEEKATKTKKGDKDKDKETEPEDEPEDEDEPEELSTEHKLESITTADSAKQGRLYWRELIED